MAFNIPKSINLQNLEGLQKNMQNFVVSPALNLGFAGFVFSKQGSTSITRKANITSHAIEDNTKIQDHVSIEPLTITLTGYVGELEYTVVQENNATVQKATEIIGIAGSLLPKFTQGLKQIQSLKKTAKLNSKADILNTASQGADIYKTIKELNVPRTNQSKAYNFFNALFESKQILSLETPWRFIPNLLIESVTSTQGEETSKVTDFTITLKEIKIVASNVQRVNKTKGRHKQNIADKVSKGLAKGEKKTTSFIKSSINKIFKK